MEPSTEVASVSTEQLGPELEQLFETVRGYHPSADIDLLERAYRFSRDAHGDQKRLSGHPFISHCVEVTRILSELNLDSVTLAAGLLHDVVEDTSRSVEDVEREFGPEIAMLVDGVTKVSVLPFRDHIEEQAENLRKMLIAVAHDIRVVLIKLADRLHNMRTLSYLPEEKTKRISKETLDIYAPLAHRLGIAQIKSELEDSAFRYLEPADYDALDRRVAAKSEERESEIAEIRRVLADYLAAAGIPAEITGRPKHLYSIHRKIMEQGREFDDIYDLLAVRAITDTLAHCYAILGIVHKIWNPVPGRFRDFIAVPKSNMYRSLHTTVMRESGIRESGGPLEIQIRTEDMHRTAEVGIAAHWRYKEGRAHNKRTFDEKLTWFRQMLEWLQDPSDAHEFLDNLRTDLVSNEVYVFTPKGDVKELPLGSTPIDFAYAVHTEVGDHCVGARVDNHIVPLRYNLQQGDVVEIVTAKHQQPGLDWLEIVKTPRARTKIRRALRERQMLAAIVEEPVRPRPPRPPRQPSTRPEKVAEKVRARRIRIEGKKGLEVYFARCCNPMPGEPIVGYVTRGRVSVHRLDCRSFQQACTDHARIVAAGWAQVEMPSVTRAIRVKANDRPNLLADILQTLSGLILNIVGLNAQRDENNLMAIIDFVLEVTDDDQIDKIIGAAKQVNGVVDVLRKPMTQ